MQPRRRFTFKVRRVKDQLTSILQPHHWMWSDICKPQWFFFFFFFKIGCGKYLRSTLVYLVWDSVVVSKCGYQALIKLSTVWGGGYYLTAVFQLVLCVGILDNKTKRPYAIDMCISHSAKSANHREQRFWLFCNTLHVHLSRIRLLCFAL